jgi:SAM-dependent methyltransferase
VKDVLKAAIHKAGRAYTERICRLEAGAQVFAANQRSIAYSFVFRHLTLLAPVEIVDVEPEVTALPQSLRDCGFLVTALAEKVAFNRHYAISGSLKQFATRPRCDVVVSVLSLQGMADAAGAVDQMFRILYPGGHLMLVVPYNETAAVEDVYADPEAAHRRRGRERARIFSRADAVQWSEENGATLREQEFWECYTGPYWGCGEHLRPPRQRTADHTHHLSCLLYRKELPPEEQ